jgi:FkbM family methyltransferase
MSTFRFNRFWLEIGKRRWLKKWLYAQLPALGSLKISSDFTLYLDLKDMRGPSFYLMYGGPEAFNHYEFQEKEEISHYLSSDSVFLDIGANIGLFSYYLKRKLKNLRILAFEPHPLLFQCLDLTQKQNTIAGVTCFNLAFSNEAGNSLLFLDQTDSGGHSLNFASLKKDKSSLKSVEVETCTLDQFMEAQKLERVDFIKIDVQESEQNVLQGAQRLIETFRPSFLIEFHNSILKDQGFYSKSAFPLVEDYLWKHVGSSNSFSTMTELPPFADSQLKKGILQTNYIFVKK